MLTNDIVNRYKLLFFIDCFPMCNKHPDVILQNTLKNYHV